LLKSASKKAHDEVAWHKLVGCHACGEVDCATCLLLLLLLLHLHWSWQLTSSDALLSTQIRATLSYCLL
jgi:hypothetical protein